MLGVPNDFLREAQGVHVTRDRSKQTHEGKTRSFPNRERSRFQVAMVTKFLDHNKPKSCKYGIKMTCMQSFLCMIVLRSKTVAHTFLPSFYNANGRLCQDPEICYHGKLTSNFSSVLRTAALLIIKQNTAECWKTYKKMNAVLTVFCISREHSG